jgi:hypothetical protein
MFDARKRVCERRNRWPVHPHFAATVLRAIGMSKRTASFATVIALSSTTVRILLEYLREHVLPIVHEQACAI